MGWDSCDFNSMYELLTNRKIKQTVRCIQKNYKQKIQIIFKIFVMD